MCPNMLFFMWEGMQEQDNSCSLHAHGDHAPLQSLLKELKEEMELLVTWEALRRTSSYLQGLQKNLRYHNWPV